MSATVTKAVALRRTILYIEDDHSAVQLFKLALGELALPWEIDLLIATNATQAFQLLSECQATGRFPDLLVLDYQLPDRNGLVLLKELRECDIIPGDQRVVFFSTLNDAGTKHEASRHGALQFIHKPSVFDEFVVGVKTACSYLPA